MPLVTVLLTGDCPYDRRRCPWATPRGRSGVVPVSGAFVGATPLWAGRGYGLAARKRRPLLAGHGCALPLRPSCGRAPPLLG
ncbi:hypothetical protein B296_00032137 [Ensete ventricosum]|uniref:Uncharacterized protein n=1 Tax=Ensete ventricosum TaxID=4639 RepID=A0A426ZVV1_ENSVE|nr:hypothetical protein B296_00032137 [Ensete ventricosum]